MRTAVFVAAAFIELNGHELLSEAEAVRIMFALASGVISELEAAEILRRHTRTV